MFFSAMAWHGLTGDIESRQFSTWLVPGLMLGLVCYGFGRGLPVYEVAVYFGAVGVRKARYAVTAALMADLAGFLAAVLLCHSLYPA
jgi:spore maturation protein SpmB